METKFYYGEKCSSCEPILFDRRNAKHPNGFVFGLPGAGKIYAVKHEICQVIRKTSDPIIIIDECGEYSDLATGVNPFMRLLSIISILWTFISVMILVKAAFHMVRH